MGAENGFKRRKNERKIIRKKGVQRKAQDYQ